MFIADAECPARLLTKLLAAEVDQIVFFLTEKVTGGLR